MNDIAITLGGVTFQSFEVPRKIALEGGERLAVHQLIGGGCVVDVLGDETAKISFSGIFSGPDAAIRAQSLDAAKTAGAQIPLFWDSFFYLVVIKNFAFDYEKPWWIPFSVACVIVFDPVAVIASDVASLANLVSSDVASAIGLSGQSGIALPLSGVATVASLMNAQSLVSVGLNGANEAMSSGAASLKGAADPAAGIEGLTQVVTSAGQLAALSSISGYINRAAANAAVAVL